MRCGTLAFDIDGVLIDARPSYRRIVKELSGATDEDIAWFKDKGGFNDDWELSRALKAWIDGGRPVLPEVQGWQDVVAACGHDPGSLAPACEALYREYWRDEKPLVDSGLLHVLSVEFDIVAVTGRSQWAFERAEELLSFRFPRSTTSDQVRKPHAEALLRVLAPASPVCLLFGDSPDDRLLARNARLYTRMPIHYLHVAPGASPQHLLEDLHREPEHAVEHAEQYALSGGHRDWMA